MNKENRNHYLGLLLTFIFAMALGYLYLEVFNNDVKPTKTKKTENEKGGACKYINDTFPAIIFSIDTLQSGDLDLKILECYLEDDLQLCDTTSYYSKNNSYFDTTEFKKNNLNEGDTICYIQMTITKGSCNPNVDYYSLEKFRSK